MANLARKPMCLNADRTDFPNLAIQLDDRFLYGYLE